MNLHKENDRLLLCVDKKSIEKQVVIRNYCHFLGDQINL